MSHTNRQKLVRSSLHQDSCGAFMGIFEIYADFNNLRLLKLYKNTEKKHINFCLIGKHSFMHTKYALPMFLQKYYKVCLFKTSQPFIFFRTRNLAYKGLGFPVTFCISSLFSTVYFRKNNATCSTVILEDARCYKLFFPPHAKPGTSVEPVF